jgi:GT2 family glycosyltransferase
MAGSRLSQGNRAFRDKQYARAIWQYSEAINEHPELKHVIEPNIVMAKRRAVAQDLPAIPCVTPENLRVTILIAVYGKLEFTLACLRSIAINTPPCYEIVLVDDCSQDDSSAVLPKIDNLAYTRNTENMGFLRSCNYGLTFSRADSVLFLNNDTEVMPGWLDPLLELLEQPAVGAVGSKLIYPDGSLQEAGGIYWNDAQGTNYGRKDPNPDRPEYNFVREVDKCSAASLLVRKEILNATGGFDNLFAPAYKEDADLCFQVRSRGYKVLYQPKSVVVHYEGLTCGTETTSGIKKYQVLNRPKFVQKWRDILNAQHMENRRTNVFLARSRPIDAPYVLIIDDKLPEYDRHAGGLGMYQYTLLLKEMGYRVVFYPDNKKRTQPYAEKLMQAGVEVRYEVSTAEFASWLEEYGKHIDYVWLSRPTESSKYIDLIRANSQAKIMYCGRDLHYLRNFRRYEIEGDLSFLELGHQYKKMEFELFDKADSILLFSEAEAALLQEEGVDSKKIKMIPAYYYEMRQPPVPEVGRTDIVFVGGFKHKPNVDAVLWFVEHCFDLLLHRFPSLRFRIVGPDPTEDVNALSGTNIDVAGYVEDLESVYDTARVAIAPIRYGAGVKGKIVNSLSFGIPVVTTAVGMEGMGLQHGLNCSRADSAEDFVREVARLLEDDDYWATLSQGGLAYVAGHYSKQVARERMGEILVGPVV